MQKRLLSVAIGLVLTLAMLPAHAATIKIESELMKEDVTLEDNADKNDVLRLGSFDLKQTIGSDERILIGIDLKGFELVVDADGTDSLHLTFRTSSTDRPVFIYEYELKIDGRTNGPGSSGSGFSLSYKGNENSLVDNKENVIARELGGGDITISSFSLLIDSKLPVTSSVFITSVDVGVDYKDIELSMVPLPASGILLLSSLAAVFGAVSRRRRSCRLDIPAAHL